MLILLPPSEGKTGPLRGRPLELGSLSFPSLRDPREQVLDDLVSLCTTDEGSGAADAARVLGLGGTQSDEVLANAALREAPAARAERVYTSVLYEALGLDTLSTAARRRAARWLLIVSGLFGLVRPGDRIPAYRLSGNVTLPGTGSLGSYWRPWLDVAMQEAADSSLVVDLRSSTYGAFWRPASDMANRVVTVRVLHEVRGTRKVVSHFNKATKGHLVRELLEDGAAPSSPGGLARTPEAAGLVRGTGDAGATRYPARRRCQRPMNAVSIGRALNIRMDACPFSYQEMTVTDAGASSIL